jgi:hypothetical protein
MNRRQFIHGTALTASGVVAALNLDGTEQSFPVVRGTKIDGLSCAKIYGHQKTYWQYLHETISGIFFSRRYSLRDVDRTSMCRRH